MRRHDTDWGALASGLVFVTIGVLALTMSRERFSDALGVIWSATLLGLGAALLLRSASEDGAGDEVGAEGGQDRQVEQAGGRHHG